MKLFINKLRVNSGNNIMHRNANPQIYKLINDKADAMQKDDDTSDYILK